MKLRRWVVVVAGVLLVAAIASWIAVSRTSGDHPRTDLKVGWGGSEGHPSCVYDPKAHTVTAKITIEGGAPRRGRVAVTVTAYADENTSIPVGSGSRTVWVHGAAHRHILVAIPVKKAPHIDEDGETACRLSVNR